MRAPERGAARRRGPVCGGGKGVNPGVNQREAARVSCRFTAPKGYDSAHGFEGGTPRPYSLASAWRGAVQDSALPCWRRVGCPTRSRYGYQNRRREIRPRNPPRRSLRWRHRRAGGVARGAGIWRCLRHGRRSRPLRCYRDRFLRLDVRGHAVADLAPDRADDGGHGRHRDDPREYARRGADRGGARRAAAGAAWRLAESAASSRTRRTW